MKLIVGLGNPGKKYSLTRHNVGFMVIDHYLDKLHIIPKEKFNGLFYKTTIADKNVIFLKPLSYMNLSGQVVEKFCKYYKIPIDNILIIRDDLDINLGSSKIKYGSSSGGDNGVKSIIEHLNSKNFGQYKIGISNNKNIDTKDFVLGKFSSDEIKVINKKIDESTEIIDYFISNDIHKTINKFNGDIK